MGRIIMATGYHQPSVNIFPKDLFPVEGDRSYAVSLFDTQIYIGQLLIIYFY